MKKIKYLIIASDLKVKKLIKELAVSFRFLEPAGDFNRVELPKGKTVNLIFVDSKLGVKGNLTPPLKKDKLIVYVTSQPAVSIKKVEYNRLVWTFKPIDLGLFAMFLQTIDFCAPAADYFYIRSNQKIQKIFIGDILYIEGLINYVTIYTTQKKYVTYLTLKDIEEQLPSSLFVRVHRSYIIPSKRIVGINNNEVHLDDLSLPLSRSFKNILMESIEPLLLKRS
jgi:two-component system, LytTR family, response regulator